MYTGVILEATTASACRVETGSLRQPSKKLLSVKKLDTQDNTWTQRKWQSNLTLANT